MPYYKDTKNKLHFIEDTMFSDLLPEGCEEIEEEDALALQTLTIQQIKDVKWRDIKAERERRKFEGGVCVTIADSIKWFHSDNESRAQYLGLKDNSRDILDEGGLMSDPIIIDGAQVAWKTMDGSWVPITCQIISDVVKAVCVSDTRLHKKAEVHKLAMNESVDPASYNYLIDWPLICGEQT